MTGEAMNMINKRSLRPTRPVIFFRAEGWCVVEVCEDEDVSVHAELNPGTIRIEDMGGNVLWRPQ